jgi:hypothetical protein
MFQILIILNKCVNNLSDIDRDIIHEVVYNKYGLSSLNEQSISHVKSLLAKENDHTIM